MPMYDYKCTKCGREEEVLNKMHWSPKLSFCPVCADSTMEKQISQPAYIHFKGSGFYENDYKNKR